MPIAVSQNTLDRACRKELGECRKRSVGHTGYACCQIGGDLSAVLQMTEEGAQRAHQQPGSSRAESASVALHEAGHIRCAQAGEVHSPVLELLVEEAIHERPVVDQCGLR